MDQNFSLMAQSRANYYTAGSPVQFVRVELLKGDTTGEVAVCLTFKNVGAEPLTGLVVHFKCKDAAGQVLSREDDFYYEQLNAQPGAVFGSDRRCLCQRHAGFQRGGRAGSRVPQWPRRRPAQLQARASEHAPRTARLHRQDAAAAHRQCPTDLRAPGHRVRLVLRLRCVPSQ